MRDHSQGAGTLDRRREASITGELKCLHAVRVCVRVRRRRARESLSHDLKQLGRERASPPVHKLDDR